MRYDVTLTVKERRSAKTPARFRVKQLVVDGDTIDVDAFVEGRVREKYEIERATMKPMTAERRREAHRVAELYHFLEDTLLLLMDVVCIPLKARRHGAIIETLNAIVMDGHVYTRDVLAAHGRVVYERLDAESHGARTFTIRRGSVDIWKGLKSVN